MGKLNIGYKEMRSDQNQEKIRDALNLIMVRTGKGLMKTAPEIGLTYETLRVFVLKGKRLNFESLVKILHYVNNNMENK